ncbi:acyl-CoA thioesterase [Candidatus Avelusimicrobium aviculae]|uniref:acyl-CoA thioesterase n=1 Tax=Candidatus Avelusimicrobium aviculae TaxID=3416206 RepID=UPI003D0E6D95
MKRIEYFTRCAGEPAPLEKSVRRVVRFNEVDPMNIMWHGHYASFFEDARIALGDAYGIGYQDFYRHGFIIPVRRMQIDYLSPLQFGREYEIKARLFYTEAARLDYDFTVLDETGSVHARGCTVQLILDKEQNLLLAKPAFFEAFCQKWRGGKL